MKDPLVVLVTGARRGLGRALVSELTDRGHVVVAGVRPGGDGLPMDVTDERSVDAAVAATVTRHGRLDVVVSNAAIGASGPTEAITPAELARLLDVNVVGAQRVARASLPHLRRSSGLLVLVSSGLARIPLPFRAAYAASKAAAESLAEGMAWELGPTGVEVAVVQVGPMDTGFGTRDTAVQGERDRAALYQDVQALVEADRRRRFEAPDRVAMPAGDVARIVTDLLEAPRGTRGRRLVVHPDPEPLRELAAAEAAVRRQVLLQRGFGALVGGAAPPSGTTSETPV